MQNLPGEKLIIKLTELLADKGIGKLLRPWQIRREGQAFIDIQRQAMLSLAQTQNDCDAIRHGALTFQSNGTLVPIPESDSQATRRSERTFTPYIDPRELERIGNDLMLIETMRREVNVSKAILFAESALENDSTTPPSSTIDEDWLFRWRDNAACVSTEDLQRLWGAALAGELKAPGTFSLRTLDYLRNLSRYEAELIQNLFPYSIDRDFICRLQESVLDEFGISYGTRLRLQELGILSGVEAQHLAINFKSTLEHSFLRVLKSNGMVLIVKHDDRSKKLELPIAGKLTLVGRELSKLVSTEPNEEYLRQVGATIKQQQFNVFLGPFIDKREDTIEVLHEEAL